MAKDFTYRADHIGSLIVPPVLSEARAKWVRGEISADGLREAENAAIKSALDMQRSAGVSVATDGAFRRVDPASRVLTGDTLAKTEAVPLKELSRRPIKVTVRAPRPTAGEPLERSLAKAEIVKKEIAALIAAGVDYIQLDAPGYADLLDQQHSAQLIDPDRMLVDFLRIDTAALSGIERPGNVRIGAYLACQNGSGLWRSGGVDQARAERVFGRLPVDRFLLPMDTSTDNFEPLRLVPSGKVVVLGLVSATTPALEGADALMAKIDLAAKVMEGDDLAVSPAAGFAAAEGQASVSEAIQRRKLELVVDVATRWWGFAM